MAKKNIDLKTAEAIPVDEIVKVITGGINLIGAVEPLLKILFDKISEAIKNAGGINSPMGRRRRIEALEAQNILQKELNKTILARLHEIDGK